MLRLHRPTPADRLAESTSTTVASAATTPALGAASASNATTATEAPVPTIWQTAATETEMRSLADRLRAAGFPASVVRAVLRAMIEKQVSSTNALLSDIKDALTNKGIRTIPITRSGGG